MKIVKMVGVNPLKSMKLRDAEVGTVFHFAEDTFEQAMSGADEASFYMVTAVKGSDPGRFNLLSLDGKSFIQRDGDRTIFVVNAEVHISQVHKN